MDVGVVGMGKMGVLHTGILNCIDGVNITSVTEREGLIKKNLNMMLPNANIYDDYEKMISNEKLDLVYITTPARFHVPIASSCINKNINFFIEKPLSANIEECRELCNRLKGKTLVHGVGYSKRFWDTFAKGKEIICSKILGDLIYVKSSMYISQLFRKGMGWRFDKKESGGGVLLDSGAHLIDLLIWYFGPMRSVTGMVKKYYSAEVEDFAHANFEFNDGVKGFTDTSCSVRGYRVPEISIEVHGSNGMMIVNDDSVKFRLDSPKGSYPDGSTVIYKQELFKGSVIDIGGQDFTKEDIHMVNCTKQNKQTVFNVFEASKTQSAIDAIYKSSIENKTKEVIYVV